MASSLHHENRIKKISIFTRLKNFLHRVWSGLLRRFGIRDTRCMSTVTWRIECDATVFDRIKDEVTFHQILALARAVNSLQFVIFAFRPDAQDTSPATTCSRINSFLFGSAILYEGLLLVESMNRQFGSNEVFNRGLHTLLGDPTALRLRKYHMNPVRNRAVFHFDSVEFGKIMQNTAVEDVCEFLTGRGNSSEQSRYPFADVLATQILMGRVGNDEEFYEGLGSVMSDTRDLATSFVGFAHKLILTSLQKWGFVCRALP